MRCWLVLIFASMIAGQGDAHSIIPSQAADLCSTEPHAATAADADLYCIELLPAEGINTAAGTARLLSPSSPFGIAVTPAGEHLYDIDFNLRDLPDPESLGPYTTYVAWATP